MIEITIKQHLDKSLDEDVYVEVPEDAPDTYVTVEKVGMTCENHIYDSTFTVQSIAPSLLKAMRLDERVREAMNELIKEDEVIEIGLNTSYPFPDIVRGKDRYQAVFNIKHY